MKYYDIIPMIYFEKSPSMRREWIEIPQSEYTDRLYSLPPCGGSGLKYIWTVSALEQSQSPSMRREWIEMTESSFPAPAQVRSPSMRREWIEMQVVKSSWLSRIVSLHAEGVD